MKRKVRQYYYNNVADIEKYAGDSEKHTVFDADDIYPIVQLGIQALPGTKFYLNNRDADVDKQDEAGGIIIGATGIFELEAPLGTYVDDLRFDKFSLRNIAQTTTEALIIDVVYEVEEEDE